MSATALKKNLLFWIVVLLSLIATYYFFYSLDVDKETKEKVKLIKKELISKGLKPKWVIISGRRSEFINSLFINSVKNSQHLKRKAIDIYVFDINADNIFDKTDIKLLIQANQVVENKNKKLKGALGFYLKKDLLSKRMVHIDTRGHSVIYGLNF